MIILILNVCIEKKKFDVMKVEKYSVDVCYYFNWLIWKESYISNTVNSRYNVFLGPQKKNVISKKCYIKSSFWM